MFKTRGRKIIGDVMARKGRTLLVSMAIFIGVTGTIALFSLSDIIVSQLQEDVKEDELSMLDVFVTLNSPDVTLDDAAYLEGLRDVHGVTEVIGIVQVPGFFKVNEDDEEFEDGFINAYTVPYGELPLEPMRLIEGEYPTEGAGEIAVEQRMADKYELSVGDQLYFRVLSPSQENGEINTIETRTITGIVFHPYVQGGFGAPGPTGMIYGYMDDANYIANATGLTIFMARFDTFEISEEYGNDFTNYIADETPYVPVFSLAENPEQNSFIVSAQTISGTMSFLAFVALIVSGFLVINVISSIVVEQKRQIGVMKSLGATTWDNFVIYAGIAFAYGVIGVIPGVIVGIPLGNTLSHLLAPQLSTVLEGFRTSPSSIILGVIVGLLVPVLASLLPVFFGTRVKILDAMTDLGIDARYGSGPLAKIIAILPVPVTVRQGFSNVSLKKMRLAFTVITLSIAAGAFMGIFAVFSSLTSGINIFLDSFNVEIGLFPNTGRDPAEIYRIIEANYQTEDNNVVASMEPGFQLQVEFEGYDPPLTTGGPPGIFAYGYDINSDDPAFTFSLDEGDPLTDENAADGIIFSSALAANMGKEIGDTVTIIVPGNTADLQIVGISDYPLDQVWIDWRTIALIAGYTVTPSLESPLPIPEDAQNFIRYAAPVDAGGAEIAAMGFTNEALGFMEGFITDGEVFSAQNPGVLISSAFADNGGYSVGDTLTLTSTAEGGTSADYAITGILELPAQMTQGGEIPEDFIAMAWENLATLDGISLEGRPRPQGYFLISTIDEPTVDELDTIIEDINETMLDNGIAAQGFNFVELVNQISQAFLTIQIILQLVALLIAGVGALGLLTTLSMSVFERQKEIGVMRSIGASSATVATQFLTEGLVVGVIAWLVGLPLGYLIQVTLLSVTGFDETFPAVFSVTGAVIGLVGMLVITTLASLWPSLSAARKTVSDILRYQ